MTANDTPKHGSLHAKHVAMEAAMGSEGGWAVPLSYRGSIEEAAEVRRRAGIFDVSHFGRIRVRGDGAVDLLERVCTSDAGHQEDDTTEPTLLCNERGGILDYCRLIRLEKFWVLVTSPICREKVLEHLKSLAGEFGARVDDQTTKTTMLDVTGPATPEILDAVLPFAVSDVQPGAVKFGSILVARYIAERFSETGEWGVSVQIPNLMSAQAWRFITDKAGENAVAPCGMAARDILRIETGLGRYGHEINETIDPVTAGLMDAVDFGHDFIGADAVRELQAKGPSRQLIGLLVEPPDGESPATCIARQGSGVCSGDGTEIGAVTSGTYSPALEAPIALAYVSPEADQCKLFVELGGRKLPAKATPLPFVETN